MVIFPRSISNHFCFTWNLNSDPIMSLSTSALGEDEELRQFIATKELQNQLTAQV